MEIIPNFVVFEGCDGCGTTTQLSLLTNRFKTIENPIFFPTFEPTESQIGKIIRQALKKEITLKPQTIAMLFAADRNEHLHGLNGILEHTKKGHLVVSDRYILSSLVYQGIECGDELPVFLNARFNFPELTIFFDIEPEIALKRMKERNLQEIYDYIEFQEKVREKYKSLIDKFCAAGAKVVTIDASKTKQEVEDQVWSIVSELPIFNI